MTNHFKRTLLASFFVSIVVSSFAQITIGPTIDINEPGICTPILAGTTVEFIIEEGACNFDPMGFGPPLRICKDDPLCTDVVFSTTEPVESFMFTFEEPGFYYIDCDKIIEVSQFIFCGEVYEIVPTLGEWAVIILFLIMVIFGTVAIANRYQKKYYTQAVKSE